MGRFEMVRVFVLDKHRVDGCALFNVLYRYRPYYMLKPLLTIKQLSLILTINILSSVTFLSIRFRVYNQV